MKPNKIIITLVIVFLLLAYPAIVNHDSFFIHIMIFILFYAVMAIGLNIIMRTGQLSIGQAAFMSMGAYFSVALVMKFQLSFWISWPVSLILCAVISLVFGIITLRIKGISFALLTFAFGEVVRMIFSYTDYFGGINGIVNIPPPSPIKLPGDLIIDFADKTNFYYLVLLFSLICFFIYYRLVSSSVGRVLRSINNADLLAECCGINTLQTKVVSFVIGSSMTCAIGSLYASYFSYISPDSFTFMKSVDLIIINVIGGVYSLTGPIVGTLFLVCIPEVLRCVQEYEHLIFAVVLILFLYFIPKGISGVIEERLMAKHSSR